MYDLKLPCDADPDCYHRPCLDCGTPMRARSQTPQDHPGTAYHRRAGSCSSCTWGNVRLLPDDLKDQRHIILDNQDMTRMNRDYPDMYQWHVARRKRLKLRLPELNTNMCQVEGCDSDTRSRGLCAKHYHRWRRHGDPTFTMRKMSS